MKLVKLLLLGALALAQVGCAYFSHSPIMQGRDKHYLNAHSIPPLRIPPGMSSSKFRNDYPIPDRNYPASEKVVSILPPGINSK